MVKKIINQIEKLSGKYSAYEVYTDWIRCMALSIANTARVVKDKIWHERENTYLTTIQKYTSEDQIQIYEMTAWLVEALENDISDVLGEVYMRSGMGNKAAGQFFTPFHLSVLSAKIALLDQIGKKEVIELNEPNCGGGGMVIAAAKVLKDAGEDYQRRLRVVAQDLDWKGVYMSYVQFSLLGIDAICVRGDTLAEPYIKEKTPEADILRTPAYMGMLI